MLSTSGVRSAWYFKSRILFLNLSIENVAYGLRIHGIRNKKIIEERVEMSLKKAAIWDDVKDRLNDSALKLSGGPAAAALHRSGHCHGA